MRRYLGAAVAALALGLVNAPAAVAFDEIGDPCVADDTEAGATMIVLSNQGSEPFMQPVIPTEQRSVITRWRVQVGPGIGPLAQQLIVSDQVAEEEDVKIAESAVETVVSGSNEFLTRIPVGDYDHVGLHGPEQTLICNRELNVAGRVKDPFAIGERRHLEAQSHVGVPVVVRVERDADGDGYGDESQDVCPGSSAFQTTCPVLRLKAVPKVKRRAVLVRVTPSTDAPVQVFGYVNWRVRQKTGENRRLTALISAGNPRALAAGVTRTFRVPLTKPIRRRLSRLTPRQSLKANLTVRGTNLAGKLVQRRFAVWLPGQAK